MKYIPLEKWEDTARSWLAREKQRQRLGGLVTQGLYIFRSHPDPQDDEMIYLGESEKIDPVRFGNLLMADHWNKLMEAKERYYEKLRKVKLDAEYST